MLIKTLEYTIYKMPSRELNLSPSDRPPSSRSAELRSPSRKRLSSIHKEDVGEGISITPDEIDAIIERWDETRKEIKELEEKEKKYKKIITKIMDLTKADAIQGKDLKVTRRIQSRRFLSRANVPVEVYDQYSVVKDVTMMYIRAL